MKKNIRKPAISGVILPENWDESGQIIEVALYTNTEKVYTLEQNNLTQALMKLIYKRVAINGKIREQPGGKNSIVAHKYIVLKNSDADERLT